MVLHGGGGLWGECVGDADVVLDKSFGEKGRE